MSLLFYPDIDAKNSHLLTCATAVAVCRALEDLCPGVAPEIKWVNDVYLGGRKLAGILCEGECTDDGALRYAIVGIGINLKNGPHSKEVEAIMTSLEDAGFTVDAPRLGAAITAELTSLFGYEEALCEYRRRSMLIGKDVVICSGGKERNERVLDIDDECALVTLGADGSKNKYISGDVKILPKKEDQ
jgi:BirA family biotin operon repressor/biotin-[acetyl-CoA-carboxylase] ligase